MPMPDEARHQPAWTQSLYWRIALGSIAVFAVLLLVQAIVFLWMSGTIATTLLGQSPDRIAAEAAKDVAAAIQKDPTIDIEKFVRERYGNLAQPLMVALEDGRVVRNHELPPPDGIRRWPGRPPDGPPGGPARGDTVLGPAPEGGAPRDRVPPAGAPAGETPSGRGRSGVRPPGLGMGPRPGGPPGERV